MNKCQIAGLDDVISAVASQCFNFAASRSELYRETFAAVTNKHLPHMERVDAAVSSRNLEIVFTFKDDTIVDFVEAMRRHLSGFFAPVMVEVIWSQRRMRWAVIGHDLPHQLVARSPANGPFRLH